MFVHASSYTRFKFSNNRLLYRDTLPLHWLVGHYHPSAFNYEYCSKGSLISRMLEVFMVDVGGGH